MKVKIKYGSVCSGVEAASLAWKDLGWECAFVSEVEPFPCAVLQQRFDATPPINPLNPNEEDLDNKERKQRKTWLNQIEKLPQTGVLPNEGDFTKIGKKYEGKIDLLVGGTPCQDLSVAGKRLGFKGKRSSLALDFIRLAYESRAKWIVWENVPGALSANRGRDFSTFLSGLTGLEIKTPPKGWKNAGFIPNTRKDRYGVAWRILDAQYTRTPNFPHAVPQRRRRIFLVGYFGDWKRAAQVLFEPESLSGYLKPVRKERQEIARDVAQCTNKSNGECSLGESSGRKCCHSKGNKPGNIILNSEPLYCVDEGAGKGSCCVLEGLSPTLATTHYGSPVINETKCFQQNVREEVRLINGDGAIAGAVSAETETHQQNYIAEHQVYTKQAHPQNSTEPQGYKEADVAKTLNLFNLPETRIEEIVVEKKTYSAEVYSLDSKSSNSMKSSNPNSGCHKTEVAKTIDTSVPEPSKNQGGIAIVEIEKDEGLLF